MWKNYAETFFFELLNYFDLHSKADTFLSFTGIQQFSFLIDAIDQMLFVTGMLARFYGVFIHIINGNTIMNMIVLGLLLMLLWLLSKRSLLIAKYEALSQDVTDLLEQKDLLSSALSDKEVLLNEIHHRVKNNYQIVSSFFELGRDSKDFLMIAQSRVNAMSIIHEMVYKNAEDAAFDIPEFFTVFLNQLRLSFDDGTKQITLTSNIITSDLTSTQLLPLCLIINEVICNAYKHAFKGRNVGEIHLKLERISRSKHVLIIKDNGVGMTNRANTSKNNSSSGMGLIRGLVRQLRGKLEIHSSNGTQIKVVFTN